MYVYGQKPNGWFPTKLRRMKDQARLTLALLFCAVSSTGCVAFRVETIPPGAQVIFDGRNLGPSPVQIAWEDPIDHTYSAVMPGHVIHSVQSKGTAVIIRLKPEGSGISSLPLGHQPRPTLPSPLGERDR